MDEILLETTASLQHGSSGSGEEVVQLSCVALSSTKNDCSLESVMNGGRIQSDLSKCASLHPRSDSLF